MTFKITERLLDAVGELLKEEYEGDIRISESYCTGTRNVLGNTASVELTGFCKESLYIVDDLQNEKYLLVGRYGKECELSYDELTVEKLTEIAWNFYKTYKQRGYSRPYEWESLFKKHGFVTSTTKVVNVEQELE